jgi:hypothetical protein
MAQEPVASQDDQGARLTARAERVIRGIEAQLRGDFRRKNGDRKRLNSELENINLAIGTDITFCLATSGGDIPLGSVKVHQNNQNQKVAEVELESQDGDKVPNVVVGDRLEARKGADCSAPLLIKARFHR